MVLVSCSRYDKLLKSSDNQLKYEEAKKYYAEKSYLRAATLFEAVAPYYKGTELSHELLYLTAQSYYGNQDYFAASNYYNTYTKTFPTGKHAEECWFMIAYCKYLQSPDARLDQAETIEAIKGFEEFLELYPSGEKSAEANKYLNELQEKLAYKSFLSAKLYYDLGNYLGNNYLSSIITAQNTIKAYPNTKYKEDLALLILRAKFKQAELSVPARKEERYRETIDEYYSFTNDFPESKHLKEAQNIFNTSKNFVKD